MPSFERSSANNPIEKIVNEFLTKNKSLIHERGYSTQTVEEICAAYYTNPEEAKRKVAEHADPQAKEILDFITQTEPDDKPPSPLAPGGIQLHRVVLGRNKPANDNAEEDFSGRMAA